MYFLYSTSHLHLIWLFSNPKVEQTLSASIVNSVACLTAM